MDILGRPTTFWAGLVYGQLLGKAMFADEFKESGDGAALIAQQVGPARSVSGCRASPKGNGVAQGGLLRVRGENQGVFRGQIRHFRSLA